MTDRKKIGEVWFFFAEGLQYPFVSSTSEKAIEIIYEWHIKQGFVCSNIEQAVGYSK